MRHVHAMIADGGGDDDAEHQRPEGVHGQVTLQEALHQRRGLIVRGAGADPSGRREDRRTAKHQQPDKQDRGDQLADALEQATGVESQKQRSGEIHQRVQRQ
ncbi:hypothetical protein D3C80_1754400 [compost metagenome]